MKRKRVLLISDIVSAAEENPKEETEQQANPESSKEAPERRANVRLSQLSSRSTSQSQFQKRTQNQSHEGHNVLPQPANVPETHMLLSAIHNNQDPRYIQANPPLIQTMGSPSNTNLIYPHSVINLNGTMLLPVNLYNHVALPIYRPNFMQQNLHQQLHHQEQYQRQLQHQTHNSHFSGQQQHLVQQHPSEQHQHHSQIERQNYQFDPSQQQQEHQPQLQPQQQLDQHLQQRQLQQLQYPAQPLHHLHALDQRLHQLEDRLQELNGMQQGQLLHHQTQLHLHHQQQEYIPKEKERLDLNSQSHKLDGSINQNNENRRRNSLSTRTVSEMSQDGSIPNQINFEHQLRLEGAALKHRNSCTRCRKLKKKCDKQEFQCQNCRKFSLSCVYLPRKQRKRGERRRRKQQSSLGLKGDFSGGKEEGKLTSNNDVDEQHETNGNLPNRQK